MFDESYTIEYDGASLHRTSTLKNSILGIFPYAKRKRSFRFAA